MNTPKQFLRRRRPQRFSDSIRVDEPALDRSMLEYHLDTLTSRSQEHDFERFAKALCSREVCPNLLPQTGPTGGGDSKVDSETYPVATPLALAWHAGDSSQEAANARWGFAFSAKKKWRPKLRSDIEKIASTGRGYAKAFFVTNQFVRDKERADIEDDLSKKYELDVRILDRSWVLDRVFAGKNVELAVELLHLDHLRSTSRQLGPHDTQREQQLETIETRIKEAAAQDALGPAAVDLALQAAELSRELEQDRTTTEGLFERAARLARAHGSRHQQLRSEYSRAWTEFWWFEDLGAFADRYGKVAEFALDTLNVYELELLQNLWMLLYAAASDHVGEETLASHTDRLAGALHRLAEEEARPSTGLQARTLLALQQLAKQMPDPSDDVFLEIEQVLAEANGLIGYPFQPLFEILLELAEVLPGHRGLQALIDDLTEIQGDRERDLAVARVLLRRGAQELDDQQPYEAIRKLGRALILLYKNESRHDLVKALYFSASAYEKVGLRWAARGAALNAASLATDELWKYSEVSSVQALCYDRLKWIELQLGRVPGALAWHQASVAVKSALVEQGQDAELLFGGDQAFDGCLGILLLRADLWTLARLKRLPDRLSRLGLDIAPLSLLFALGHVEELPEELRDDDIGSPEDLMALMEQQPAAADLPDHPEFLTQRTTDLISTVLGCEIRIHAATAPPARELAETVVAGLESLLATGMVDDILPRVSRVAIRVRVGDFAEDPFQFEVRSVDGRTTVEIKCAEFNPHTMAPEVQASIQDRLRDLLVRVLIEVFAMKDPEATIEQLVGEDRALHRALRSTGTLVTLGNVLGHDPPYSIDDWIDDTDREYDLLREDPWRPRDRATLSSARSDVLAPDAERLDMQSLSHRQVRFQSLIPIDLWDQAKWIGTAFASSPGTSHAPVMAPVFAVGPPALEIFRFLRNELGREDSESQLRVSILRGINASNPHAYRVVIGSSTENLDPNKVHTSIARMNTMEPATSENLDAFLSAYAASGRFVLAPAHLTESRHEPEFYFAAGVAKQDLTVRWAWEIGRHDPDVVALQPDDVPIIPPDNETAPVLEALDWLRQKFDQNDGQG